MNVLYFDLKGRVRALRFPDPVPGARDVVVRTRASVISTGTETQGLRRNRRSLLAKVRQEDDVVRRAWELYRSGFLIGTLRGDLPTGAPFRDRLRKRWALGYAAAGIVSAAGDESGFAVGDRLACAGHPHADVMRVTSNLAVRIPDGVSDEAAAFAAIGAIALRGVHRASVGLGDVVGVVGLGVIGLLTTQILAAYGVRVIGVDPLPARRDRATAFGAERVFAPGEGLGVQEAMARTEGRGTDAVIVTAGTTSSAPLALAGRLVRERGRVVLVGATGLELPRGDFYRKEADVLISRSYGPGRYDPEYEERGRPLPREEVAWDERRNLEEFLRLVAARSVTPERLVDRRTRFEDAPGAYDELLAGNADVVASVFLYDRAGAAEPVTSPASPGRPDERTTISPRERGTPTASSPPARRAPIPVAVIGHGDFARRVHLPELAGSDRYALRHLVGRSARRAAKVAETLGIPESSDRIDAALGDPGVEAVFIFTRHDTHGTLTRRALDAGKAVFVEKPLALVTADAEAIVAASESSALPVGVGFNRRHSALATPCRDYAARRKNPIHATFRVAGTFLPASHWVYDPEVGGGRVVGEACHFVDFLRWVLGEEVRAVHARGGSWTHPGVAITDSFCAILEFEGGSVGTLIYGDLGRSDFSKERFELFTGEFAVALDDFRDLEVAGEPDASRHLDRPDKGFERELAAFADYVRSGTPGDMATAADGLKALELSLAVERSIRGETP